MRDHEEGMDEDFWRNAERLLGVGYDGAVLGVEEDKDPEDENERFTAWVAPPETHEQHRKWKWDLRETAGTRKGALEALSTRVRREMKKQAYARLHDALPYGEWRRMEEEAELLLSVKHKVVLGSRGDDEEQIALNLLRRDYWQDVRRHAGDLVGQIKSGEITSAEEFDDRLREIEVIYTSDAHKTLWMSDNDEAYEDEMGEKPESITVAAVWALQADVRERVQASIEVHHLRELDCPRCGTVVVWSDPDGAEADECRKCGYDTCVAVSRAYASGGYRICEVCRDDHPDEPLAPVDHRDDFRCDECGGEYTQPEETPGGDPAP